MENINFDEYLRESKHSETLLINQLSLARAESKQNVYKFGFGQSPFPIPEAITEKLIEAAHRKEYMNVQGDLTLRKAIAEFHNEVEGKNWKADRIIVGTGSKILIFCLMSAFKKAEVLLPSPSWVSYDPQGKLAGHPVHWVETRYEDRWRLMPDQLNHFCEQRADRNIPLILVLNYPNNPTGQSYNKEELKALAEVMRKHKVIVIADEIYSLLTYQQDYGSIADYYPEGCVVSSGISKWCGAGGWRLGFHYIPEQLGDNLLNAMIGVASETYSCAPSPIQVAATHAYQNKKLAKDFIDKQTRLLNKISQYCVEQLTKSDVLVHKTEGGFYLFPDFRQYKEKLEKSGITTGEQLTAKIMQDTGVALLPGSAFGMPFESLTARLAFVDFDGGQIFEKNLQDVAYPMVEAGILALCDWLEKL